MVPWPSTLLRYKTTRSLQMLGLIISFCQQKEVISYVGLTVLQEPCKTVFSLLQKRNSDFLSRQRIPHEESWWLVRSRSLGWDLRVASGCCKWPVAKQQPESRQSVLLPSGTVSLPTVGMSFGSISPWELPACLWHKTQRNQHSNLEEYQLINKYIWIC